MIERQGRYLLRRRQPGTHLENLWEFPGGKVEPGESWEAALARELAEEIGVRAEPSRLILEKSFEYPERTVRIRFYSVELDPAGEPRSPGPEAPLLWATPVQLLELPVPDANREIVARLTRSLVSATGEESPLARWLDVARYAVWGLPVTFVIAALIFIALDEKFLRVRPAGSAAFTLAGPGDRRIFFGLFLTLEAALVCALWLKRSPKT